MGQKYYNLLQKSLFNLLEVRGVITLMDKYTFVRLKLQGLSNRQIAKELHINRKTVNKYWRQYKSEVEEMQNSSISVEDAQEKIVSPPVYNSSNRKPYKYTDEIDQALNTLLQLEEDKHQKLGPNKQHLTYTQIHHNLCSQGYDISLSTISTKIKEKRNYQKECFIKQEYNLGDRVEFDFGDVKLEIHNTLVNAYMAVFSSPASNLRWAYLYTNQKKAVFLESHVSFFEMMGGVYREVVYDNMKNVVTKFLGRNEKELNPDLIKMGLYYGYVINVTNCYSPEQKGHVESSVKILRNEIFAQRYQFDSWDEAEQYLQEQCKKHNENSLWEQEKQALLPYKPKLELAEIRQVKINTYSFARIDNHFYSVPDYLVGKTVTAKIYAQRFDFYANNHFVCTHKRSDQERYHVQIQHYLPTLRKKPGAIRNSMALKSNPALKSVFEVYYVGQPRVFIDLLLQYQDKPMDEIIPLLQQKGKEQPVIEEQKNHVVRMTLKQLQQYSHLSVPEEPV